MIVLAVASYIVYQFKPVSFRRLTASKPKQANYILIKVYIRKSVGFIQLTRSRLSGCSQLPSPDERAIARPTLDMIRRATPKYMYDEATLLRHIQSGVTRCLFITGAYLLLVASLRKTYKNKRVNAISIYMLSAYPYNGSAVCATKVRISFHITAIYAYLKVHLYEKLTPHALKQHIFEHLSKEKRKAYRH